MKTPIYDFVKAYTEKGISRFHMPAHKGVGALGIEALDITEIKGADALFEAQGIIGESESYAAKLFGSAKTLYSTEGSTLAIQAMLAIVCAEAGAQEKTLILAARNAHKAFLAAAALLDFDFEWIYPSDFTHITSCKIDGAALEKAIASAGRKPSAVYVTSPDYLGQTVDISELSSVCKAYSIPLLVDNAHGAYLAFESPSLHPLALGADMCCDSAHKTLPALTGGAYLHVSKSANPEYAERAKDSMALFASTSPSYLILQSLDLCNAYLESDFPRELKAGEERIRAIKERISSSGFSVLDSEALKIVIDANAVGYTGYELADMLRAYKIECEFADGEFLVLMPSTKTDEKDFERLEKAFSQIKVKKSIKSTPASLPKNRRILSPKEAFFAKKELVKIELAEGRICAEVSVSCPPAVPVAVCGELMSADTVALLKKYGVEKIKVVK